MTAALDRVTALAVYLHGERIGVVTRTAGDRQSFAFEESYLADESRPMLSLSFKSSSGGLIPATRSLLHEAAPVLFEPAP